MNKRLGRATAVAEMAASKKKEGKLHECLRGWPATRRL